METVSVCLPYHRFHGVSLLPLHSHTLVFIVDDRHNAQIYFSATSPPPLVVASTSVDKLNSILRLLKSLIFLVCYTLISLGYTIRLAKPVLIPSQSVLYLGFDNDSFNQTFRLLPEKRDKFILLVKDILSRKHVSLLYLQKLSGKCVSFSAAVPAARLFTNELYMAVSKATRSSKPVFISPALRREIEHWLFLESCFGFLTWRLERHFQFKIHSDASSYAWGSVLNPNDVSIVISDYWREDDITNDIVTKETLALSNVLSAFAHRIKHSWVDVYVDNRSLADSWRSPAARSHSYSDALKRVFSVTSSANLHLNLIHIPSHLNVADPPSRTHSLQDSKLADETWAKIQLHYGGASGHTIDLMALPSNAMIGQQYVLFQQPCPHLLTQHKTGLLSCLIFIVRTALFTSVGSSAVLFEQT